MKGLHFFTIHPSCPPGMVLCALFNRISSWQPGSFNKVKRRRLMCVARQWAGCCGDGDMCVPLAVSLSPLCAKYGHMWRRAQVGTGLPVEILQPEDGKNPGAACTQDVPVVCSIRGKGNHCVHLSWATSCNLPILDHCHLSPFSSESLRTWDSYSCTLISPIFSSFWLPYRH